MAIGDIPSSPSQAAPPQPIDIEAWTEQATVALGAVTISTPGDHIQGASVTLAIPLDEHDAPPATARPVPAGTAATEGGYYRRKEVLRRDSLKRREAVLKGKEGSRRRQRWENGMPHPIPQGRFAHRPTSTLFAHITANYCPRPLN
jgi:hypothetical protein